MNSANNILEIPVSETKDVHDLAKWFEKKMVHKKEHPGITIREQDKFPTILLFGFTVIIGMALMLLEEKGKMKVKASARKKKRADFLDLLKNSKTEFHVEKLIEDRYDIDLILTVPHHGSIVSEPQTEYTLNDVFGIWKNKKHDLESIRKAQWGKRL